MDHIGAAFRVVQRLSLPWSFTLRVDGLTLAIAADAERQRDQLFETLSLAHRSASSDEPGPPTATVRLCGAPPPALARVCSALSATVHEWPTFHLLGHQGQPRGTGARLAREHLSIVWNLETGAWYFTDRSTATTWIVGRWADRLRGEALRYVSTIISSYLRQRGYVALHAAAARMDDLAILAVGGRGTGKTTLLLTLAHEFGAAFASNDRVMLLPSASSVRLHGLAGTLKVQPGALSIFPDLIPYAPASLRPAEARQDPWGGKKFRLGPAEVRTLFKTAYLDGVERAIVLFPFFDAHQPAMVRRLSPGDAISLLREHLLPEYERDSPGLDSLFDSVGADSAVASLASELPGNPRIDWYRVSTGLAPATELAACLASQIPELRGGRL